MRVLVIPDQLLASRRKMDLSTAISYYNTTQFARRQRELVPRTHSSISAQTQTSFTTEILLE
jgi:hypothetical protein